MARLVLAFKILFSAKLARQVLDFLESAASESQVPIPESRPEPPRKKKPARSEAITLLAVLQREARFIDFIKESIDAYSDAQVGAAVREIHRGCAEVIQRMFAPVPIVDSDEGSTVEVPDPASGLYRLTGNVGQAAAGIEGQLMHHGWTAATCEVPKWSGEECAVNVIAAAEVQVA